MANWCNVRLIVTGARRDVLQFSRISSARPSSMFAPDMLQGEADNLMSERIAKVEPGLAKKVYIFQVRNDDGQEHFRGVSLRFPMLNFVLVYADPNVDLYGSYFISRGQVQNYELPDELKETVMAKHGVIADTNDASGLDNVDDADFWEANWELMDLAEAYWQDTVLSANRR